MPPLKKSIEGVEVRKEVIVGIQEVLNQKSIQLKNLSLKSFGLDLEENKAWYPLENLLKLFTYIEKNCSPSILQRIGAEVAKKAKWPDTTQNAEEAIRSINLAYHMNHRRDEQELFDYEKGEIIEGYIGHDILEIDHKKEVANFICGSFYPSDFNLGMAKQVLKIFGNNFIAALSVKIDKSQPSRKTGGETCTYNINYKVLKL